MTANVTFVYAERKDVLRIPTAALRFRPSDALLAERATDGAPASKTRGRARARARAKAKDNPAAPGDSGEAAERLEAERRRPRQGRCRHRRVRRQQGRDQGGPAGGRRRHRDRRRRQERARAGQGQEQGPVLSDGGSMSTPSESPLDQDRRRREDVCHGRRRGRSVARRQHRHRRGRVRRDHGTVGVGQIDAAQHPGLLRPPVQRQVPAGRRGGLVAGRQRAGGDPQPDAGVRVPELQPAGADDRARERRAAAGLRGHAPARPARARRRRAGARRPRRSAAPPPQPAVGRAAAAGRDRARAGRTSRASCSPTSRPATSTRAPAPR